MTNCPNCGAPIPRDGQCEYCGTWVVSSQRAVSVTPHPNFTNAQNERTVRRFNKSTGQWEWTQEYTKTEE